MNASYSNMLRWYLWILMSGLLLHGLVSLLFRLAPSVDAAMPYLVRGIFGIDVWHAWIHIAWGGAGSAILARSHARQTQVWLALGFGTFYSALAIAGVLIHHPLGLELDAFENGFHLTAGPTTLLIGILGVSRIVAERAMSASQ
jgi:hypothetical protein